MSLVTRYLEPALVERLSHLQLSARMVVEGATSGIHKSALKGSSIEFRQHRPYVAGDEPRRLDWRVLGRTNRPYVKEYDEETNLRCMIVLDRSGSMGYGKSNGTKFDFAAKLAASLAYLMLAQTESVGLATFGAGVDRWLGASSRTQQLSNIIEILERTAPSGKSDLVRAVQQIADRLGRRSLIVLISDLFVPAPVFQEALARVRHERHETIVLRVLDRDEMEFPFRTWCRFRGMESETQQICEPTLVRKRYLARFADHASQIEQIARTLPAELATFTTDRSLADSLTTFLRRRAARAGG
jgi:uncharacterized protein (DUF58 family)